MSENAVAKLLDRLTSPERFRALVAAYSRGDTVESSRLQQTTPKRDRMPEFEMLVLWQAALVMGTVFIAGWGAHLWRSVLLAYVVSKRPEQGSGSSQSDEELEAYVRASRELAAMHHGLREACLRVGIDFEQYMATFALIDPGEIEALAPVLARFDPGREDALNEERRAAEAWLMRFACCWAGTPFEAAFADLGPVRSPLRE